LTSAVAVLNQSEDITMPDLSLTPINGEPRIQDVLLGKRLGFDRPRDIRKLIERHAEKLKKINHCATVARRPESGGREVTEYYLDRKQSIFICMKSETDNAVDVQMEIIEVYDAYLDGQTKALQMPNFSNPAEAARAWALEYEAKQAAQQALAEAAPKVAFHDQVTHDSDTLIDFTQAFSLLKRRTGQTFTKATFLAFLRRHGVAKKPNRYTNIGRNRFQPRNDYINTWFVSEVTPAGGVEWMLRPYAIAEIVRLIEKESTGSAMVASYLTATVA
jgi:phage antirepressor YoqD-like protein